MPQFEAKTRSESRGEVVSAPGYKVPECEVNNLAYTGGGGSAFHREFAYTTRKHSVIDCCRPGYFTPAVAIGIKLWDVIKATIGGDPESAVEITFRVIEMPSDIRQNPVIVAKSRETSFTPCRTELPQEKAA